MGRKSLKDVRRKEIVKAFYSVAKKEGLENTSIAKAADYLKINPSLIMHYFKTRDELMIGLIDYILERYQGIYKIEGGIESSDKLIRLIDNLFSRKWNRLFDDGVFYSCYALTYRNKTIRDKFKELHVSLRKILQDALEEAKRNQLIEIENIKEAGELIFIVIEGAYYYGGILDDKKETERQLELCKRTVLNTLNIKPVS